MIVCDDDTQTSCLTVRFLLASGPILCSGFGFRPRFMMGLLTRIGNTRKEKASTTQRIARRCLIIHIYQMKQLPSLKCPANTKMGLNLMAVIAAVDEFCLHMSNYHVRHQAMPGEVRGAQHEESNNSSNPPRRSDLCRAILDLLGDLLLSSLCLLWCLRCGLRDLELPLLDGLSGRY